MILTDTKETSPDLGTLVRGDGGLRDKWKFTVLVSLLEVWPQNNSVSQVTFHKKASYLVASTMSFLCGFP